MAVPSCQIIIHNNLVPGRGGGILELPLLLKGQPVSSYECSPAVSSSGRFHLTVIVHITIIHNKQVNISTEVFPLQIINKKFYPKREFCDTNCGYLECWTFLRSAQVENKIYI